jgi:hypothetical protein
VGSHIAPYGWSRSESGGEGIVAFSGCAAGGGPRRVLARLPDGQWVLCSNLRRQDASCAASHQPELADLWSCAFRKRSALLLGGRGAGGCSMNCLECATRIARTALAQPAIGSCAHCGAGICLDHARYIPVAPRPVGLVPQLSNCRRRVVCTSCDRGADPSALTVSVLTEFESRRDRPPRRSWSALVSAWWAGDSRSRRSRATS